MSNAAIPNRIMAIALRTVEFIYFFQILITPFVFAVIQDQSKSNKTKVWVHKCYLFASILLTYGAMDCGGFISLFTVAAQAKGIATVVQASVTGYAPVIRDYFDIPESRLIQTAISFGYEDPKHPANGFRTERAPITDVITIVAKPKFNHETISQSTNILELY